MNLKKTFEISRNTLAAASLATVVAFSGAATANDNVHKASYGSAQQCAPLYQTSTGRKIDASYSSYKFSQENIGAVGISIFPGQDTDTSTAHDIGEKIATVLKANGVEAVCFVHNEQGAMGTGVNFNIVGLPWSEDRPLKISEALSKETLRGVLAKAKTAKSALSSITPEENTTITDENTLALSR